MEALPEEFLPFSTGERRQADMIHLQTADKTDDTGSPSFSGQA